MVVTTKTCSTCRVEKPRSEYHRNLSSSDGSAKDPRCKPCRQTAGQTHVIDQDLKRNGSNARRYGLTAEQYAELATSQAGLCAICHEPETMTYRGQVKTLSIDHDHVTGKVRGLLCASCNFALGKFYDNPARLRAAADYLER